MGLQTSQHKVQDLTDALDRLPPAQRQRQFLRTGTDARESIPEAWPLRLTRRIRWPRPLGIVAAGLVIAFQGSTDALIPLFAVGVFICFTLSQAGMARLWWTRRGAGWLQRLLVNGAWAVLLLVPTLIWSMYRVREHYLEIRRELFVHGWLLAAATHKRRRLQTAPHREMACLRIQDLLVDFPYLGAPHQRVSNESASESRTATTLA